MPKELPSVEEPDAWKNPQVTGIVRSCSMRNLPYTTFRILLTPKTAVDSVFKGPFGFLKSLGEESNIHSETINP